MLSIIYISICINYNNGPNQHMTQKLKEIKYILLYQLQTGVDKSWRIDKN